MRLYFERLRLARRAPALVPAALLALALLLVAGCGGDGGEPELRTITFESGAKLEVEIADEEAERLTGLMFRRNLEEDRGMLFIYPDERILTFFMRNTYVPLSIAYLRPTAASWTSWTCNPSTTVRPPRPSRRSTRLRRTRGGLRRMTWPWGRSSSCRSSRSRV